MDTTTLTPRSLVAALVEVRLRGGAVESIAVVEPLGRGTPQWPWGRLPRMPMWRRFLALLTGLGRGIIAGAAGDDAGGIATYASVRAQYGYTLLWALGLSRSRSSWCRCRSRASAQ